MISSATPKVQLDNSALKIHDNGIIEHKVSVTRNSFISPELAYSHENRSFFDKIGYNKNHNKQSKLMSLITATQQPQRKKQNNPDKVFIRKRTKVNDTFYEKRALTISQSKERPHYQDEIKNTNQSNILKKLMTARKLREQQIRQQLIQDANSNEIELRFKDSHLKIQDDYISRSISVDDNNKISQDNNSYKQSSSFMGIRRLREQKTSSIIERQCRDQYSNNYSQLISKRVDTDQSSIQDVTINDNKATQSCQRTQRAYKLQIKSMNKMNFQQHIPSIKGISKQLLQELYQAKCDDLQINPSKEQMTRFFDLLQKKLINRKLDLSDMGIGDNAVVVVGKIIKSNESFAQLDLKKNNISNFGIKKLSQCLKDNNSLVHLSIGCNQITAEGFSELFQILKDQASIVSLNLANTDCYKNKNKLGVNGCKALSDLLSVNNMLQIINLSDNSVTSEGLQYIVQDLSTNNSNIISLNLSQNDIGSGSQSFHNLLQLFAQSQNDPSKVSCSSLEQLILSSNQLANRHIEELSQVLKNCSKTRLQRLDLSNNNKLTAKSFLQLIQTLKYNQQLKLTHLNLDKSNLEMGTSQEQVNNFYYLLKAIIEYLRSQKSTLQYLSLNNCLVGKDIMNAIGKGLQSNEKLQSLSLRCNNIDEEGLSDLIDAFECNHECLKLKFLDLTSNRLNDQIGVKLAHSIGKLNTFEQIYLKDNNLGPESGDAFYFLVQQKKNLWKCQLDMNMIKYPQLVDIKRICKRNKRNAKYLMHLLQYKQEISNYVQKIDSSVNICEVDKQIQFQKHLIKNGQKQVIDEEQQVQNFIKEGDTIIQKYQTQKKQLQNIINDLDKQLYQLDFKIENRQKEFNTNLYIEENLIMRCKDIVIREEEKLQKERMRLNECKNKKITDQEEIKLKEELEKIVKEQYMLKIIMDNYQKEINRKQGQEEQEKKIVTHNLIGFKKELENIQEKVKIEQEKCYDKVKNKKHNKKRSGSKMSKKLKHIKYIKS